MSFQTIRKLKENAKTQRSYRPFLENEVYIKTKFCTLIAIWKSDLYYQPMIISQRITFDFSVSQVGDFWICIGHKFFVNGHKSRKLYSFQFVVGALTHANVVGSQWSTPGFHCRLKCQKSCWWGFVPAVEEESSTRRIPYATLVRCLIRVLAGDISWNCQIVRDYGYWWNLLRRTKNEKLKISMVKKW